MANEKVVNLKQDSCSDKPIECHLMPCRIECNKPTVKAREYFWPTIKELKKGGDEEQGREKLHDDLLAQDANHNNPILTASFRGKPLQGRKIKLPDGYKGCVVASSSVISKDPKIMINEKSKKEFNEFTYWNWDELPSDNDTIVQALQWINISKAIHGNSSI